MVIAVCAERGKLSGGVSSLTFPYYQGYLCQTLRRSSISAQHSDPSKPKRSSAFPSIIGIAAIVFALDQLTKFLVLKYIPYSQSWSFFPALARIFRFTFITNTGAAFGMFPQLGSAFMVVAIVVVLAIILFYRHLPTDNIWIRLSLGLQLGGAMGNLLDRMMHGYVVDFIDIGFWPIFNLADLSIVVGVTILAYFLWDEEENRDKLENLPHFSAGGSS